MSNKMGKEIFDKYYNMTMNELTNIDIDLIPDIEGELVMVLSNPHKESYEELKNTYVIGNK